MSIRNQLLCVNLNISCWEARRQDKKVNNEVAAAHGTATGVGRYHKDLLPEAPEHTDILKMRNAWRVWHYENTLPWGNDGARVLRSASFLDYMQEFNGYKDKFDAACEVFYTAYPTLVAEAELKLNTLFNAADYPLVSDIKHKFNARLSTYPLPDAEDFRVIEGIPPVEADRLCKEAVLGMEEQVTYAVKDLWSRLHTVVSAMQERLNVGTDGKPLLFRDSLVTNIEELLERVPRLNLTGDPEITTMTRDMAELVAYKPATLRGDMTARTEVAAKAAALAKRMAIFVRD